MFDMELDQIVFIAKNKEWVSVKKLLVDQHVKNEDVSLILSQIQKTINGRSFEYAGVDVEKVEEVAAEYCAGARKNMISLSEIFAKIKGPKLKEQLLPACKAPEQYPVAEFCFVRCVIEKVGYFAYPTPEILQKVYPNLKVAKPRGNYGKKKKK
ncbi:hypothetical protein COU37_00560 [Candidatus Micrarchaeota archaeon CG10_big_fil_rev_8_21_14_0_10_45_29]|nr:MAG: hypothetical protein COU37_00560 [Candidatus Micrarchaeota archaeon CG10_big_fil_rev_8_21_14_0_10_45_29]